jgi:hypothetical protein
MLKVGTAEIDITPPLGVPMAGYAKRKSGCKGVHDAIMARAIVVDNGPARIGWVIADLIGLLSPITRRFRDLGSEMCGIPADCLMISATHDHGGPDPRPEANADNVVHRRYLDDLPRKLAECLAAAAAALEPAKVSFGRAVTDRVQHNRRYHMLDGMVLMDWDEPDPAKVAYRGPVDPAVQVLAFEGKKGLRAALVQFACHATVMDSGNLLISGDWPGAACRHLQGLLSAGARGKAKAPWVAVAQGCCGDVNPRFPRDTFEEVEAKGRIVAETAKRALERAVPVRGEEVGGIIVPVKLPRKNIGLDAAPTGEFLDVDVQAFRIGDTAIVGLNGECFVGIGLAIKAYSEFRGTFAGSYANDYEPGYIPVGAEYAAGGYEVETSKVARGGDVALVEAARQALEALERA